MFGKDMYPKNDVSAKQMHRHIEFAYLTFGLTLVREFKRLWNAATICH